VWPGDRVYAVLARLVDEADEAVDDPPPLRPTTRREVRRGSRRRRRLMRRRSPSDAPPHTPSSIRLASAYSKHSTRTGQLMQTSRAVSTPARSDGKNAAGLAPRQRARLIQASGASAAVIALAKATCPSVFDVPLRPGCLVA